LYSADMVDVDSLSLFWCEGSGVYFV
jgi:hypothetical protein